MTGHSWKDKLAWVGVDWEILHQDEDVCHVKCRHSGGGASSFGDGRSLDEALCSGAYGLNISWHSVECKMTEAAWARIAHC